MQQRPIGTTGLTVSEIGFGAWTVATGWWGSFSEDEAKALLRQAFSLGITFFNTSNVYGDGGYGERIVGEALADVRDQVTIATTFGYDVDAPRAAGKGGHAERPHDWSRDNVMRSLERSLANLGTDCIDMWQLHNPRMDAMRDDALWDLLAELRGQGLVRSIGPSIGPAIGWREEGLFALRERDVDFFHHIWNMLEQDPGREHTEAAAERDISMLVRVPHSSGLLEDRYDEHTTFPASDHRSHRKREWLEDGLRKVESLRFLVDDREGATLGQVALKWALSEPAVASVQPNIYELAQLQEFAAAPDVEELDADELGEIDQLFRLNYGLDDRVHATAGA